MKCFDKALHRWAIRHGTIVDAETYEYAYLVDGVHDEKTLKSLEYLCKRWGRFPEFASIRACYIEMILHADEGWDGAKFEFPIFNEPISEKKETAPEPPMTKCNPDDLPF